jgi:endonuclease-3
VTRRERADRIASILDRVFPAAEAPLDHEDAFQLLVATILSAQCTDARVNIVTPALFARAPDAATMAMLRPYQIKRYIKTCGLAGSKAKNIAALAKAVVRQHGGVVPNDIEALETLPGVGHKTASVVMAQAFGEAAFPVDTHIHRLAARWQLSRARNVDETERDLKAVFPRERWSALHLKIIFFGRTFCPALFHKRDACPICSWAMSAARAARELREERAMLERRRKPKKRSKRVRAAKPKRRRPRR